MKETRAQNDNQITRTLELWQPRSRRTLSDEDAREMVENVAGFFRILAEWAAAEAGDPADETERVGRRERP